MIKNHKQKERVSSLIKKAVYFAAQRHDGQYRKGTLVPYFAHPFLVAINVSKYTKNQEVVAAALLHDTIEDCPDVSIPILKKEFGNNIAQLVNCVTFLVKKQYSTWKEKKLDYLEKIKHTSKNALIIIAADKMNNMEAYFTALKKEGKNKMKGFGGTPDEYHWYYAEIEKILISKLGKCPIVKDYIKIRKLYK